MKIYKSLLAISVLFLFVSCSGSSKTGQQEQQGGENPPVIQVPQPGSDPIEIGGGNAPVPNKTTGVVQKGPFIKDSDVVINELDDSLTPTERTYATKTTDDLGTFKDESGYNLEEIIATGYYFSELPDGPDGTISAEPATLKAIVRGIDDKNVNALTTIQYDLIKSLKASGSTLNDARVNSKMAVMEAFNLPDADKTPDFNSMDMTKSGDGNTKLLAASAIVSLLPKEETSAQISQKLADIAGKIWDNNLSAPQQIKDDIQTSAQQVSMNAAAIQKNIEDKFGPEAPKLTDFVKVMNDGILQPSLIKPPEDKQPPEIKPPAVSECSKKCATAPEGQWYCIDKVAYQTSCGKDNCDESLKKPLLDKFCNAPCRPGEICLLGGVQPPEIRPPDTKQPPEIKPPEAKACPEPPSDCKRDSICMQALTVYKAKSKDDLIYDGLVYPTGCGPWNCNLPVGCISSTVPPTVVPPNTVPVIIKPAR